jgi:outer membrane lipoprotein SlyB
MKILTIVICAFVLSACMSPAIDEAAETFDTKAYETDLFECRGGNLVKSTAITFGAGVVGSLTGALHGAVLGGTEGSLVGGAIGAAIGLAVGFEDQRRNYDGEIADCLKERGYTLNG